MYAAFALVPVAELGYVGCMTTVTVIPGQRDIRTDLKQRLRDTTALRDTCMKQVDAYTDQIGVLTRMIEIEDQRYNQQPVTERELDETLPDFIERLARNGPMTKDQMRAAAEGAGYAVDGRSIHAVTVNLQRGNRIFETSEGVFAATETPLVRRLVSREQ